MRLCPRPAARFAATMIEPVFAAGLAALLVGEALGPFAIAGCLLLLAAIGLLFVSEIRVYVAQAADFRARCIRRTIRRNVGPQICFLPTAVVEWGSAPICYTR